MGLKWKNLQTQKIFNLLQKYDFTDYIRTLMYINHYDIRGGIYEISEEFTKEERLIYYNCIKKVDYHQLIAYYRIQLGYPVKNFDKIF